MRRYITLVGSWITEKGQLWAANFTAVGRWITEKGPLWADKLLPRGAGLGRCGPCVFVFVFWGVGLEQISHSRIKIPQ